MCAPCVYVQCDVCARPRVFLSNLTRVVMYVIIPYYIYTVFTIHIYCIYYNYVCVCVCVCVLISGSMDNTYRMNT